MNLQKLNIAANHEKVNLIGPMPFGQTIDPNTFALYVDGGVKHQQSIKAHEFNSIGDNDSHDQEIFLENSFPPDKDQSDLKLALEHLADSVKTIEMFGFWGGRQDHFLFNIGEIFHSLNANARVIYLYGDSDHISFHSQGKTEFEHTGIFSLISLQYQKVKVQGALYSGGIDLSPLGSLGLSNQAMGKVIIEHKLPLGIFITSKNKDQ